MSKTLILLFHRHPAKSKANAALAKAAATVPGVEVVDVQSEYPDGRIDFEADGRREAERLLTADRIVLQFPIQWYSTPPLLKAWQDAVLTRMYYIFAETEGDKLKGTPLMIAATAGNLPGAYTRGGQNHFTVDEIFTPLKATAYRCGLPWHEPYLVFEADRLAPDQLDQAAHGYAATLERFIATTTAERKAA
ncbi:NAD(P)H-dependent oxidoreductase [Paracoccus sp. 22332]|uniref:NAD(P)H-dependent oxidoreductase n=1 Tax=Paracoccus sp. 22332 TaxID=3453913 RepID=UPI003F86E81B